MADLSKELDQLLGLSHSHLEGMLPGEVENILKGGDSSVTTGKGMAQSKNQALRRLVGDFVNQQRGGPIKGGLIDPRGDFHDWGFVSQNRSQNLPFSSIGDKTARKWKADLLKQIRKTGKARGVLPLMVVGLLASLFMGEN